VQVAVIGAGPAGLVLGMGLVRRGHRVVVVDRDHGPPDNGPWARRGVMQFHHAHAFRSPVVELLEPIAPEAWAAWEEAGAERVNMPDPATGKPRLVGVRSRRETFERAVRRTAACEPDLELRQGHVDDIVVTEGRATGLVVDGETVPADLVIDASGRSGRVTQALGNRASLGGSTGIAYVDRQYQLHPGAEMGPLLSPIAWVGDLGGYQVIVFPHERGIYSALVVRRSSDRELARLREDAVFEAACRAVPVLAEWTDPERSKPITPVLPGGNLLNHYRSQFDETGQPIAKGLLFVGDSVCTTTPNFGRGVTTTMMQVDQALRLLDAHGTDLESVAQALDAWTEDQMKPWVEDHVVMDEAMRRRWSGEEQDPDSALPSDQVLAAAEADPEIMREAGPYASMAAGPRSLGPARQRAKAVYDSGWHPTPPAGPNRDELVAQLPG
jgi:2-polyprenyl-6-methoxyphenol hydroxylase-like FAD-dependent oxidoreductase